MKKYFSHAGLRKQLEFLNLAIGVVLILISLVYLMDQDVEYFASWFIFGCMYMVMDKYWPSDTYSSRRAKADMFKYTVNLMAFIVSIGFLFYIL
tara:strand:- start:87 stop:368 length:282 start_codon:yes stop_codon:yes gene_type:complete